MKFLQNNNNLPTLSQQQLNTTTTEVERGEDPGNDIPNLHGRQDYNSEVDNNDVFPTSRKQQKRSTKRPKEWKQC